MTRARRPPTPATHRCPERPVPAPAVAARRGGPAGISRFRKTQP
ncbi:UDP-glucose dehydrogenase (EC 1.1.1.22) [Azospirillum argentinense]